MRANGLLCKVLGLVPRHERIVSEILGNSFSRELTVLIGLAEVGMAIWVWTDYWPRWNARLQIFAILIMNVLEWLLVPHLLLWGKWNSLFALLFCALIFYWQFILGAQINRKQLC